MQAARQARIKKPDAVPEAICRPGFGDNPSSFVAKILGNLSIHVFRSVREGSLDTYQSGFNAYLRYCSLTDIQDPFLRTCSLNFLEKGVSEAEFPVMALAGFLDFLYTAEGKQPSTVGTYLSGVRHHFKSNRIDLTPFSDTLLSAVKSAISIDFLQDHLALDTATLPYTTDFIVFADNHVLDFADLRDWAFSMMSKLAFCCLARRSEVLVTADNHYIRGRDVVFQLTFPSGHTRWVPSSTAHEVAHQREYVTDAAFSFNTAKNDLEGSGNRYTFNRQRIGDPKVAFDLVIDAFDWACAARPELDDAFISYRGLWTLPYAFALAKIKLIASRRGLDPKRYKLHSLRVGGASTLAAAGKPDHFIQKMGRWKSLAFLGYIRLAVKTINDSLSALVNPFIFSVAHVMQLNPAAALF